MLRSGWRCFKFTEWSLNGELLEELFDNLHQEAGAGGQGGSELGASEGSDDPGGGSVCPAAAGQDHPAGG